MKLIETKTHIVKYRHDGILEARTRPDWQGTFNDLHAKEFVKAINTLCENRKLPFLLVAYNGKISQEARRYLSINDQFIAKSAIVYTNPVTKIMGNFFLGFNRPQTPIKLFTNEEVAVKWLLK